MKKTHVLTRLMTASVAATLLVAGCKKEASQPLSRGEEEQVTVFSAESELESQAAFDDVFNNVLGVNSELGIGGVGVFGRAAEGNRDERTDTLPRCISISITPMQPLVFPKTVVLDFGSGCMSHGHLRSGKITTVYSGRLIEPGSSATTTFDNYSIDSFSISGTHTITNTTNVGGNQRQFTIDISNAKLSKPNGNYEDWDASRVITQIEGNGTVLPYDDIFRITGHSSGKTKRGDLIFLWSSEIGEPLVKKFNCRWFSKGTVNAGRNGSSSGTQWIGVLDFGTGDCDNKATLTVNGNVYQITLH